MRVRASAFHFRSAVPETNPGFCFAVTGTLISPSPFTGAFTLPISKSRSFSEVSPVSVTFAEPSDTDNAFRSVLYITAFSSATRWSPALAVSVTVNVRVKNSPEPVKFSVFKFSPNDTLYLPCEISAEPLSGALSVYATDLSFRTVLSHTISTVPAIYPLFTSAVTGILISVPGLHSAVTLSAESIISEAANTAVGSRQSDSTAERSTDMILFIMMLSPYFSISAMYVS